MKKVLYFAALLSLVLFGSGCTKPGADRADSKPVDENPDNQKPDDKTPDDQNPDNQEPGKTELPKVETCSENLVLWISFDMVHSMFNQFVHCVGTLSRADSINL